MNHTESFPQGHWPARGHWPAIQPASLLPMLSMLLALPLQAGTIETIAGTGQSDNNGLQGPARAINVGSPFGVEFGPDKGLYITEVTNHRILRLDPVNGKLATIAGTGKQGYTGDGGPATKADLNEPYEIRFDDAGNIYFVEMKNHIIRCIDKKSGTIRT
ncbi:MAG: hypothetical protein GY917_09475, partial [Planctomycetaceae bacterium]|nr:hypothetical protein [Planctomycetaceae bacterium]